MSCCIRVLAMQNTLDIQIIRNVFSWKDDANSTSNEYIVIQSGRKMRTIRGKAVYCRRTSFSYIVAFDTKPRICNAIFGLYILWLPLSEISNHHFNYSSNFITFILYISPIVLCNRHSTTSSILIDFTAAKSNYIRILHLEN